MPQHAFDVCVVGAGLAGMVAARELARAGAAVAILRPPARLDEFKIGESLAGAAVPLLRDMGLVHLLQETGQHASPGSLSAWGMDKLVATDFISSPQGLGWVLDRAAFERGLFREMKFAGVTWIEGKLTQFSDQHGGWILGCKSAPVTAGWVVDATGRRAQFARTQGAVRHDDNGQLAVVRWFPAGPGDRDRRTMVESVENGWWYTSLLPNSARVAAFHGEGPHMIQMYRDPAYWNQMLAVTNHISRKVAFGEELARPRLVQACGSYLENPCGRNWLAVGDAALAFDPISAQGMFSAIYTGLRGAQVITKGLPLEHYTDRLKSIRQAYVANVTRIYREMTAKIEPGAAHF